MRINTVRLRVLLGILATILPIIVAALYGCMPPSISATYYTAACITPFMIILGASSILLMSYKGYTRLDDIILTLAGVMGLCICLFPCYTSSLALVGTFQIPAHISDIIHCAAAIIFFMLLAFNSFFLFTKGSGTPTRNKKIRNVIYRICGVGMLAAFSLLLLPYFYGQIWVVETIALFFFGVSFLTKADVFPFLFCDTPYVETETDD